MRTVLLIVLFGSFASASAQYVFQWDQYYADHSGDRDLNPIPYGATTDYFNNVISVGTLEYGYSWYVSRYSSRGTHRWTQTFRPNISTTHYAYAACADTAASMIVTGSCFSTETKRNALTIVKYSQYGELEFAKIRSDLGGSSGSVICATKNGGFVVGGWH